MRSKAIGRTELRNWLANNPRLLGVAWALTLLFAQIVPVLADGGGTSQGP